MPLRNFPHGAAYQFPVLLHDCALLASQRRGSFRRKSVLANCFFHASPYNVQVRRAMLNFSTLETKVIAEFNSSGSHYRVLWQSRLRELSAALCSAH
jgi:hypothetical protein